VNTSADPPHLCRCRMRESSAQQDSVISTAPCAGRTIVFSRKHAQSDQSSSGTRGNGKPALDDSRPECEEARSPTERCLRRFRRQYHARHQGRRELRLSVFERTKLTGSLAVTASWSATMPGKSVTVSCLTNGESAVVLIGSSSVSRRFVSRRRAAFPSKNRGPQLNPQ
jgi:hypothetical protein